MTVKRIKHYYVLHWDHFLNYRKCFPASISLIIFYVYFATFIITISASEEVLEVLGDNNTNNTNSEEKVSKSYREQALKHSNTLHLRFITRIRNLIMDTDTLLIEEQRHHNVTLASKLHCKRNAQNEMKVLFRTAKNSLIKCNMTFYANLEKLYESDKLLETGLDYYARYHGLKDRVPLPGAQVPDCMDEEGDPVICYVLVLMQIMANKGENYAKDMKTARATDLTHPCYKKKFDIIGQDVAQAREDHKTCLSSEHPNSSSP